MCKDLVAADQRLRWLRDENGAYLPQTGSSLDVGPSYGPALQGVLGGSVFTSGSQFPSPSCLLRGLCYKDPGEVERMCWENEP